MLDRRRPRGVTLKCWVYVAPCCECNLINVDQTGKRLETRVNQHKDAVRLVQVINAVYKHVRDINYAGD